MSDIDDLINQFEIEYIESRRVLESTLTQLENVNINDTSLANRKNVAKNLDTACQSYHKMIRSSIGVSIFRYPENVLNSPQRLLIFLLGKGREIISNEFESIRETKPYLEKLESALSKVKKMNELCGYDIMTHND